ncbi:MAG: putative phosphoribosyl transferase [Phormidesmis priestleyi Ana]|uniref:Putative phosphoribosyl transferase n=1 Tax=Phormidesmis priestleyi Ana TaxID=1666911 RepID=A0A0N8KMX5_9CYAN|nr:MAG: putative phosphoribosyl transferase [Phormidesmis priestleyi Ana]
MTTLFRNRIAAGQQLATELEAYANQADVIVLALPRGGVPVAYEVAQALNLPLDICLVRKLGLPGQKEFAMGAIASGGVRLVNEELIHTLAIPQKTIAEVEALELKELERRDRVYRGDRPLPLLQNRTVILIDDGLATGATMRAAIAVVKSQHAKQIVVAVPVAPESACKELTAQVDQVICLLKPTPFHAIGSWYENFDQISDDEVTRLLAQS